MARFRKLNGWRRLWVVIAAGTLVFAVGWGLVEGAKQHRVEYQVISGFDNPACARVIQMPAQTKLNPEPGYRDPCWDLYLYRSIYEGAKTTKDEYIEHMNSMQHRVLLQVIGFALIVWLVAVALLYGIGLVVAWVVKGFRSGEEA